MDEQDFKDRKEGNESEEMNDQFVEQNGDFEDIDDIMDLTREDIMRMLNANAQKKLQELAAKREAKEISKHDLDLGLLHSLNEFGLPLTRKDMEHESGPQALVMVSSDFEEFTSLEFINAKGERILFEKEYLGADDVLVLYPHELGYEEVKIQKPADERTIDTKESHETEMMTVLREVFSDVADSPQENAPAEWDAIIKQCGKLVGDAIRIGRLKGIPENHVRRYVFEQMHLLISKGHNTTCALQLKNFKFGSPEQQTAAEDIAAKADATFANELKEQRMKKQANDYVDATFADIPSHEELAAELPSFWESLTEDEKVFPAGTIKAARQNGIPEAHVMRFAYSAIQSHLVKGKKPDYLWIADFMRMVNIGSNDAIAFFEELGA